MLLEGKNAVITGGGSGIGAACVEKFAREGAANILIADVNLDAANAVAKKVSDETGAHVFGVKADVTCEADVKNVFKVFSQECGRLDILLNNAGISKITGIYDMTCEQWDRTMSVNVRSAFLFSREALKLMEPQQSGRIVNMTSQAAKSGGLNIGMDYAVSKAGIWNLTKSLAKYAAKFNITVNSVAPGLIATSMTTSYGYDPTTVPLGRIGTPEEVADVVLFAASDLSRYMTGACLDVNGGILMS